MIQSLFVLNATGEAIIEKHWRGNVRREDSDIFWSALLAAGRVAADVPPFLPAAHGVLVHVHRADLFLVAAVGPDTPPLAATDFLARLADTLLDYFGELNEHAIKENFITVYELLDEMLDNGFPLTVEPNMLKRLVLPPTVLLRVLGSVTGDSSSAATKTPFPSASPLTPWRRNDVKYGQNEIFVDVSETVDAIFSSAPSAPSPAAAFSPKIIHAVIRGNVLVNSRLSGVPDITMTLQSVAPVDDTALHHCVHTDEFQNSGAVRFVPPDGPFTLMSYVMRDHTAFKLPIELDSAIDFDLDAHTGSVTLSIRPRFTIPPSPYSSTRSATTLASNSSSSGAGHFGASSAMFGTNNVSHVTNTPFQPEGSQSAAGSGSVMLAQVIAAGGRLAAPASATRENSMECVEVTIPFGRGVASASLSANIGSVEFDSVSGTSKWIVGNVARGVTPTLSGTLSLAPGRAAECGARPSVLAKFKIPGLAASGMYVSSLELGPGTSYKYFKGLRCITSADRYELRT